MDYIERVMFQDLSQYTEPLSHVEQSHVAVLDACNRQLVSENLSQNQQLFNPVLDTSAEFSNLVTIYEKILAEKHVMVQFKRQIQEQFFNCEICKRSFVSKRGLGIHTSRMHNK